MTDADRALLARRPDLAAIAGWVAPDSRILDLGCGDGMLLRYLWEHRRAYGYGIEIDDANVGACVRNDVNVLQMNLESGLSSFQDGSFDCVILSQTMQAVRHTEEIMHEILRVGREAIVSFPNFGYWVGRLQVLAGRMPVWGDLTYQWYDTPNVHLFTIKDFEDLCAKLGVRIRERVVLNKGKPVHALPNLRGSMAVYRCSAGRHGGLA